jgi:hypothetical protein
LLGGLADRPRWRKVRIEIGGRRDFDRQDLGAPFQPFSQGGATIIAVYQVSFPDQSDLWSHFA